MRSIKIYVSTDLEASPILVSFLMMLEKCYVQCRGEKESPILPSYEACDLQL